MSPAETKSFGDIRKLADIRERNGMLEQMFIIYGTTNI